MLLPPKGYRTQNFNCCETCKHSMDEEGYLECFISIGIHEGFEVNLSHLLMCPVRPTAICDSFQRGAVTITDEMIKEAGLMPKLCDCPECREKGDSIRRHLGEIPNDNSSTKGIESKKAD